MSTTPRRRTVEVLVEPFRGDARFEIRRVLGQGGMGVVYEAFDRERGLDVALKTLRHVDAQALFRLKTEFRARADLEHRNLVRLGELLHLDGHWLFTMELLDGRDFVAWVRDEVRADAPTQPSPFEGVTPPHPGGGPGLGFDERRLRGALRQLAQGLDALHRAGMVHRDLKPSNVMVTTKGRVVLLDFGLVTEARGQVSDSTIVGTAAYMAPEQAMSRPAGPAADWYSVGVMLFEALTGRLPIDGTPMEILMRKQREAPARLPVDAPPDLAALCHELLATEPAARPSGAEVVRRLAGAPAELGAPSPLVGRARELAALDAALAQVAEGATVALCLTGESGIGKSKLVRHFCEHAAAGPHRPLVLAGRCHERETVPYKGLDGVVDALARALARQDEGVELPSPGEAAALVQTFPVLLRVPALARVSAAVPSSVLEQRARAFRGLRRLFERLAARRPVIVTIDDVQWADADTLTLLAELVHGPAAPAMLVVMTRRDDGPPPELPIPVQPVPLGRLSDAEAEEMIAAVAPGRVHEAAALVAGAGGHPMFLRELLRHGAPPHGARLDDALWLRISRMELPAQRILELVAVAGKPMPQALIADALGIDARHAAKWFGLLRSASLVRTQGTRGADPVEPYHDRVRHAVLARIAPARRRRYHARLAAMLISIGADERDPLTVIAHLEAAGRRAQAAALARRAARRSEGTTAFEQLAAVCAAALRLDDAADADVRRHLMQTRAEALACAGRGPEAAEAYLAAAQVSDPEQAFSCRRAAAEQLLVSGFVAEGLRGLEDVLAALGDRVPRGGAEARRALAWSWLRIAVRGTRFRERPPEAMLREDQLRLDAYRTASLGLGMVDPTVGAVFQARALRLALRAGDRRRIAYALGYHAMYVGAGGDRLLERARAAVAQSREIAEACASPFLRGWARTAEGIVAYFSGDFATAVHVLSDAEVQLREHSIGTSTELAHMRMFLLFALRRQGDFHALRAHYLEYLRDAIRRGDRYATTTFRWSANIAWLAADDVVRAHADLDAGTWSPPEQGLHLQHWFAARARVELALYEGDAGALAASDRELRQFHGALAHVQVVRAETAVELARIAILRGDARGARRELARLRRERAPYLRARC